jgi:hypothetical protein
MKLTVTFLERKTQTIQVVKQSVLAHLSKFDQIRPGQKFFGSHIIEAQKNHHLKVHRKLIKTRA